LGVRPSHAAKWRADLELSAGGALMLSMVTRLFSAEFQGDDVHSHSNGSWRWWVTGRIQGIVATQPV
jgi:hypothetical protein